MTDEVGQPPAFSSPQELVKEIAKITQEVRSNPRPPQLSHEPTSLERIDAAGFNPDLAVGLPALLSAGGTIAATLLCVLLSPAAGLWALGVGIVFTLGVLLPVLAVISTPKGSRFWTRVIRKNHYLELHEKEKSRREIFDKAYEQALAKHEKVVKRMRKRAKPIIEAYNAQEPLKELVFDDNKGFVARNRYTPDQEMALGIASTVFDENPEGLVSTPGLKKLG